MTFDKYKKTLQAFNDTGLANLNITDISPIELENLMNEQDRLISIFTDRGTSVAGWKIMERNDDVIISPIFDFQTLPAMGESISRDVLRGTEIEVCFSLAVPHSDESIDEHLTHLETYAAVELIRPEINISNHSACDFYFNYGVVISQAPAFGELTFSSGTQDYVFSFMIEQAAVKKREVLKQGVIECIRRGYGGETYFFITGTLNGLVPITDTIGSNTLRHDKGVLISFDII